MNGRKHNKPTLRTRTGAVFLADSSCLYDFDSMLSTAIQRHGNLREGSSGIHPFRTILAVPALCNQAALAGVTSFNVPTRLWAKSCSVISC